MNNPIGIFDSGIGGITILNEIRKLLPNENIIYYADSKNNPYGPKTDKELLKITNNIVNYLINKNCKIIVIACNTATTRCIKSLRENYPNISFIGTEPAIKLACDNNHKNILVLATHATINSISVQKLITNNKKENQTIYLQDSEGLANAIEMSNSELISKLLDEFLIPYQNKNIDSIVLGCTHYPYVNKQISAYFNNATIYDSSIGVAKETKRKLKELNLLNNSKEKGLVNIIKS